MQCAAAWGRRPQNDHGGDEQTPGPGDREPLLRADFAGFAQDEVGEEAAAESGRDGLRGGLEEVLGGGHEAECEREDRHLKRYNVILLWMSVVCDQ